MQRLAWTIGEFKDYCETAAKKGAPYILAVWNSNARIEIPKYVLDDDDLVFQMDKLNADEFCEISKLIFMKSTLAETLEYNEICMEKKENERRTLLGHFLKSVECGYCRSTVAYEPLYDYLIGNPYRKCPVCGLQARVPKINPWFEMSRWEKTRAVFSGVIVSVMHGLYGFFLMLVVSIFLDDFYLFNGQMGAPIAAFFAAGFCFIATLYYRFSGIFAKNNLKARKKRNKPAAFSWRDFREAMQTVDISIAEKDSDKELLRALYCNDEGETEQLIRDDPTFAYHVGIVYLPTENIADAFWVRASLPRQYDIVRGLHKDNKLIGEFYSKGIQNPLMLEPKVIILDLDKSQMIEVVNSYYEGYDDDLLDTLELFYNIEKETKGFFLMGINIGILNQDMSVS